MRVNILHVRKHPFSNSFAGISQNYEYNYVWCSLVTVYDNKINIYTHTLFTRDAILKINRSLTLLFAHPFPPQEIYTERMARRYLERWAIDQK